MASEALRQEIGERGTPLRKEIPSSSGLQKLGSFRRLFLKKASDLQCSTVRDAREAIEGCQGAHHKGARFEAMYESLRSHLLGWLDRLGQLVKTQVSELAQRARDNRDEYCERDQEPQWARMEVETLLLKSLGQDVVHGQAWIDTELSAVQQWSKSVCEGEATINPSDAWTAPVWYEYLFNEQGWIEDGRPERLTAELTEITVDRYQSWFGTSLREELSTAEDYARLEADSRSPSVPPRKPQPESETVAQVKRRSISQTTKVKRASNLIDDKKAAVVFLAIKQNKTGNEYCQWMNVNNIAVPFPWLTQGCPKRYTDAYRDPKWRELIHKEKSRFLRRLRDLRETNTLELERIMGLTKVS